jgi:hypothetical protein
MPEDLTLITLFTAFLDAYGRATPEQQQTFLDFIKPQSRDDLLNLADALYRKFDKDEKENP